MRPRHTERDKTISSSPTIEVSAPCRSGTQRRLHGSLDPRARSCCLCSSTLSANEMWTCSDSIGTRGRAELVCRGKVVTGTQLICSYSCTGLSKLGALHHSVLTGWQADCGQATGGVAVCPPGRVFALLWPATERIPRTRRVCRPLATPVTAIQKFSFVFFVQTPCSHKPSLGAGEPMTLRVQTVALLS